MGEVYAAFNASGDEFAVKVLYPHLAAEEESFSRFRREWDVAFRLSGRYTPNVLEIAESPEGPYIVMERLRGEDLGAFLRRRDKLSKEELLPLMQSLAVALDEIHGAGVVHRDLKPANVFLLPDGSLRLLDFGIARFRESTGTLTADAQVLGTPGYLAPEQARGEKGRIGPGTDVFALGVIFYRALTGVLPFSGRTALEAIDEVCRGNHRPPSTLVEGVPKEVDAVLAVVFAKDILRRYASAGAFVRDLAAALRGEIAPSLQERAAPLASPLSTPLSTPLSDPRTLVLPTSRSPR
jgi:serine/threonine-protein kinase